MRGLIVPFFCVLNFRNFVRKNNANINKRITIRSVLTNIS